MAAETGFLIDGTIYETPTLESLDGDEALILFDYCNLAIEDFVSLEDETQEDTNARNMKQMRHPGFWGALMHIAYRRKHRELKDDKIKALIGKTNRLDALATLGTEEEEKEEVPLASTSEPDAASPTDSLSNDSSTVQLPESSGTDSTNDSGQQDATHARIGTTRSDTSSLESHRETSVA